MRFKKLYEKYHGEIEFAIIYIREAHASDKWWLAETKLMGFMLGLFNPHVSLDIKDATTIEERRQSATACKKALLGDIPVYVDEMDNLVDLAYVGWPTRVYFIGLDGRVVYESGKGPYGIDSKKLGQEIDAYLGNQL